MTRHLLVIGAQRCGTTYLHTMLDSHPDIAMARPSRPEPKVFLADAAVEGGLAWYHSHYFAHVRNETLLGEKSTSYIEHPKAAARAAAVLGAAQIVVMLRDPLRRAVSNWQFSTASGLEERPLREALLDNLEHPRPWDATQTSVSPYAYLERGRYVEYLDPWYSHFPGSVHVLFFERFVGNRDAVADLYSRVAVDPTFTPGELRRHINRSEDEPPPLRPEDERRLRAYFTDSNQALARRLGQDLPWS